MSTELSTFIYKQEMQKAASKFVGEHDFRNFCKMDAANVSNYRRHITEFTISACGKRLNLHFSLTIFFFSLNIMHCPVKMLHIF